MILRSRSIPSQIVRVWMSITKREVGLRLKGIHVLYMVGHPTLDNRQIILNVRDLFFK